MPPNNEDENPQERLQSSTTKNTALYIMVHFLNKYSKQSSLCIL